MKPAFTHLLLWSILLCSGVLKSNAQATEAADYYFNARSGTYTDLSGGTTVSAVEVDDGLSSSISIGFTFTYCGTDYTTIYASSNGWISFGSSPYLYAYPGSTTYLATGSSTGIGPAAMPLWDDVSGVGGNASYLTTGTAPNRVFTIEFKNWFWDYSVTTPVLSFQVKLYEGTNTIEFVYKDEGGTPFWDYSAGATIGIGGGTSSDYLVLDDAVAAPTASAISFTNTITTKPATGQIYEFSPYPPCSGTPTSATPLGPMTRVCPAGSFTLMENTSDITTGKTYQWRSRPASTGVFTDIPGATNSALTTSITANTDFELYVTCTESGLSSTSATKTVEVIQPPLISASGPVSFCSNQSLTLSTTPVTTYSYHWVEVSGGAIPGATTTTYDPVASGRYTIVATTTSCTAGVASTDTVNVTVLPAPAATINPSPSVTICDGETTTLSGGGTGNYQWLNSTGIITGSTGATLITSAADDYRLEVTSTVNGCRDTSSITTVVSTAAPTVTISPADSVEVCTGLSAILNSTTTGSGLSYQWYNTAGALSSETGTTLSTPDAETYLLVVTAGSCKDTSNSVMVKLLPLPDATVTSSGTTQMVCHTGTDLVLQAPGTAGYTYQWQLEGSDISGATARNYNVGVPGTYTVKVTDDRGCIRYSDPFMATPTPSSIPHISPGDLSFCEGGHLMLYTHPDIYYVHYQWYRDGLPLPGDTLSTYVSTLSGMYELQITDSFNCKTKSAPSPVTVNPLPSMPIIKQLGKQLSTGTYSSYQWYRNGKPLAGATSRFYDLIYDGFYNVEVTNAIGCSIMSDTFLYQESPTGITDILSGKLSIYPNPSAGKIQVAYPEPVWIEIKDIQGRTILAPNQATEADLGAWPDGMYWISIRDGESRLIRTEKIFKYTR